MVGRGNFFVSTYELFGRDIEDSHEMFGENVELLVELCSGKTVNWAGSRHRAPIVDFTVQPAPAGSMPIWIGGGASPASLELAARLGLDLMLPSAFGSPAQFVPIVEQYREAVRDLRALPHAADRRLRHVNVAETSQAARTRWEPRYRAYFELMKEMIPRVNPVPPPFMKKPFNFEMLTTKGPAAGGLAGPVTERLATSAQMLHADTNLLYLDMGGQPPRQFLDMVELIGEQVLPRLP